MYVFFMLKPPKSKLLYSSLQRTKLLLPCINSQLIFPVIQCLKDKEEKVGKMGILGSWQKTNVLYNHSQTTIPNIWAPNSLSD